MEDGRRSGIAPPIRSPQDKDSKLKRILRGQVLLHHPDLIVTVYHMDLNPILCLAEELGSIPLVHLATDLDVKMWEIFGRAAPLYPKFCCSVPFDLPESWETVAPLVPSQVFLAGYPVRAEFLAPTPTSDEVEGMRNTMRLGKDEHLVLIMTGGGGQDVPWTEMLANSTGWVEADGRLRVVIVAGKNEAMVARLERALKVDGKLMRGSNQFVTVEVARDPKPPAGVPYFVGAAALRNYMDVATCVISKPGGGSTSEIAYRGVPSVLDASKGAMHWEDFTIKRFEEGGRAIALRSIVPADFENAVRKALALGRGNSLALGPDGRLLDTGARLRKQSSKLSGISFNP